MFSFTTFSSSARSYAISSTTGATTRHGPHQAAQKSTSTGLSDSRTSAWKLLSVTSVRLPAMWGLLVALVCGGEVFAGHVGAVAGHVGSRGRFSLRGEALSNPPLYKV